MKATLITLIVLIIVGVGAYLVLQRNQADVTYTDNTEDVVTSTETEPAVDTNTLPESNEPADMEQEDETIIGTSVAGRPITAYHFGEGDRELLFVGGIHGGYEWNTVLLSYELMDYLEANPDVIPDTIRVTVIPVLNPDGLYNVVGTAGRFAKTAVPSSEDATIPGRFNAHDVDLNRNFDCEWSQTGVWQNRQVSGGSEPFSEPESAAIRDYVLAHTPESAVVYYSAAGGVYSSSCNNGVLPETRALTNRYATASGYPAFEEFDFYKITGDMVNWLAKNNIPAISVLLTTHSDTEWNKNKKGVEALLNQYEN